MKFACGKSVSDPQSQHDESGWLTRILVPMATQRDQRQWEPHGFRTNTLIVKDLLYSKTRSNGYHEWVDTHDAVMDMDSAHSQNWEIWKRKYRFIEVINILRGPKCYRTLAILAEEFIVQVPQGLMRQATPLRYSLLPNQWHI